MSPDHSQRVEEEQLSVRARPYMKRCITELSPRLGVLNNIPFAIPFRTRMKILRSFIVNDRHNIRAGPRSFERFRSRTRATIRRGHVAEDGIDKLRHTNLKHPIRITFIDQFGKEE
jgi:ubiquitin-protein ligase E3 C